MVAAINPTRSGPLGPRGASLAKAVFEKAKVFGSRVDVKEPSDVAGLPNGGFLLVGDLSTRIEYRDPQGTSKRIDLPGLVKPSGCEGLTYDPVTSSLFVTSEDRHRLLRYSWNPNSGGPPVLQNDRRFELGDVKNKGIEGLAFLSGELSANGKPHLLLVNEGHPRSLALMDGKGERDAKDVELDGKILEVCDDFSGVAVDPLSGHVFISSEESATVAELRLVKKDKGWKAELMNAFTPTDSDGHELKRIEGLSFNPRGDLFLVQENARQLTVLKRTG